MTDEFTTVAVIGSANLDVVVHCTRQPAPGETVLGHRIENHPGGKGLNQALAAAQFAPTTFIGAVGADDAGRALLASLERYGVDAQFTMSVPDTSGTALISVAATGENSIIVIPGANSSVTIDQALDGLNNTRPETVVAQLEIPAGIVVAAARWAVENDARFVFNPSPIEGLTDAGADDTIRSIVAAADPLIVNLGEGAGMLGINEAGASPRDVAIALARVARSVIVTDGSRGAHVVVEGSHEHIPTASVRAVDTTGAGDSFAGTVAALVSTGHNLADAAAIASRIASELVATPRSNRQPHP